MLHCQIPKYKETVYKSEVIDLTFFFERIANCDVSRFEYAMSVLIYP